MKFSKILLGAAALLMAVSSCKKADEFRDVVYMTGTESSVVTRMTIDGPSTMGISATCSSKIEEGEIGVAFACNPELVASYNEQYGSNYEPLPEGCYMLSAEKSSIKAGSNVSEPVMFCINSTETMKEGVQYMMPISIASANGIELLESCRTLYVVINQTIITPACHLSGRASYIVPGFAEHPELKSVPQITMECRVKVDQFCDYDPYITSIMGIEHSETFLLRFGDVTIEKNQLQLTAKDQLTASTSFDTDKWYHIAVVFDGASLSLYVNGVLDVTKPADKRDAVNLYDGGDFNIGYSYNGRYMNGAFSEMRVWTKALTQVELESNMCYVDPASEGLLAYWRFNEGTGTVSKDMTGHGFDAVRKTGTPGWIEGVRCPE